MKTRVERINPYLNVNDLSNSMQYYVNVLGFDLYVETPNLGIVESNGHQIHLIPSNASKHTQQFWIGVDDIENDFEVL